MIPLLTLKGKRKGLSKNTNLCEIIALIESLEENPQQGTYLGNDIYKIRLIVKSKGKGKRGGARVMTKVKIVDEKVYMFSIYNKGEKDDISDNEIRELIKEIP